MRLFNCVENIVSNAKLHWSNELERHASNL
jgi:hypothetical protein